MVLQINNILSNLLTVLNPDRTGTETALTLRAGEVLEALVLSKEGDTYLLQTGGDKFYARSEAPLQAGELVRLSVLGRRDDDILLKNITLIPGEEADEAAADRIARLIKKYGLTQEKEIFQVRESLTRIPCEETRAVRYLLDPHLLAALLIPAENRDETYQKIEINGYKSTAMKKNVWEVILELDMPELGRLDLAFKMVEDHLYLRVWAELADTESLLRQKQEVIASVCTQMEIIPALQGPLFCKDAHRNIDLKV